jgi:elongation factor G
MSSLLERSSDNKKKLSRIDRLRNIGIVAHIDSGKTTITERMLKISGKIRKLGEVHDGEATMDFLKEEQERGITITSAATNFSWGPCEVNLIDTPGHVDFTAEVERSLRVLDGAVLAIDSVAGAQAQSETVNRQLNKYRVPRLVFVNKLDRVGADFQRAVKSVRDRLHLDAVPIQMPIGEGPEFRGLVDLVSMEQVLFPDQSDDPADFVRGPVDPGLLEEATVWRGRMLESLSMHSDELMALLLDEADVPSDLVRQVLRKAVIHGRFVPSLLGSALRNRGVPMLLDCVVEYLPSPRDIGPVPGQRPRTGEEVAFEPEATAPLGAIVFKTVHFTTGDLTFVRVYSGTLEAGMAVFNARVGRHERVGRLFHMHAASREPVDKAEAGQIVACMGLKDSVTGDSLSLKDNPISFGATTFAEPVISQAIEPKSSGDRDRLGEALGVLQREDPTFRARTDPETGQTLISGMGELHLEIIAHRLRDDFRIEVTTGKPRVAYRQTLKREAEFEARHIKQTGGSGQYAVAKVHFEPVEGDGFEFVDEIKGGKITAEFLEALRRGIQDRAESGGEFGAAIQGIRVTCNDGKMHDVDSSQMAFYACGGLAMRTAEEKCGLQLLEPIMKVVVSCPDTYMGSVLGDLNSRRGTIVGIDDEGQDKQISAHVPLAELAAYATTLRSLTSGRGNYSMEPEGYKPVPESIAAKVREER